MGVVVEEIQPSAQVGRRNARHLQPDGGILAGGGVGQFRLFPRLYPAAFPQGDGRIWVAHVYLHALLDLPAASRSCEADGGLACLRGSLHPEAYQLVSRLVEAEGLLAGAFDGNARAFRLDGDAHVLGALLHGKHIDGHLDFLAGGEYPRQGGEEHQRRADGHGLLGVSVASVFPGNEHHAHRADILRQAQGVDAALAFIYMEWPDELHHRLEAVGLGIGGFQHLVSSRAEDGGIASGGGTQDLVVQVPRGDAQGFAGIELLPRVGCAEVGEVQQTFVHDGEGVGHRLACLFAHGDGEVGLRAQGVGHFYPWLEHSGGVGHRYRRHAIHSDG